MGVGGSQREREKGPEQERLNTNEKTEKKEKKEKTGGVVVWRTII